MKNHIDAMFEQAKIIGNTANSLTALSEAFYRTGNDTIGARLGSLASSLDDASQEIVRAVGAHSSEAYRSAEQASINMVNAALAVGRLNNDN